MKSVPLKLSDIVKSFGRGPFHTNTNVYVIDVDSLPKKKYSILFKYVTEAIRPIILVASSKDKVHKKVLSKIKTVCFNPPTPLEVEKLLKQCFAWDGDIRDIYDPDMRKILTRIRTGALIPRIEETEEHSAKNTAFMLSTGHKVDFTQVNEPFWWVLRWLAYNQGLKLPSRPRLQLENLAKLSEIDARKFSHSEVYLQEMSKHLNHSPRRAYFHFPPWNKKVVAKEEKKIVKLKKKPVKQVDFSQWL